MLNKNYTHLLITHSTFLPKQLSRVVFSGLWSLHFCLFLSQYSLFLWCKDGEEIKSSVFHFVINWLVCYLSLSYLRRNPCIGETLKIHHLLTFHWQFEAIFPACFLCKREGERKKTKQNQILFRNINSIKTPWRSKRKLKLLNIPAHIKSSVCFRW